MERNTNLSKTSPQWLDKTEYAFKSHYFDLGFATMHYVDEGVGEPVVMVHGNPVWSFVYRKLIKGLSQHYRCIAPDHIGFGLSSKQADWDYLPINHAANLDKLLNSLNINNITLVVNDWGGPTGLSYAIKYPEKIKRLIVLNTWMWNVDNDPYYIKFSNLMGGTVGAFLNRNFNVFGKVILKQVFADKKNLPPAIHQHYLKQFNSPAERKGVYVFPREIVASGAWLEGLWNQRDKINKIPTTFIWGMKDIAFRQQELDKWVANWTNPKVITLQTAGHYPQEEAADLIVGEIKG